MSDSVRPHRRQPTRLPCPWDSPGKNTGVGCHFLLQRMKVKSESEIIQSCPTLSDPMDCSLPGSSIHGIFQARVLEWGAIAFCVPKLGAQFITKSTCICWYFVFKMFPIAYISLHQADDRLFEVKGHVFSFWRSCCEHDTMNEALHNMLCSTYPFWNKCYSTLSTCKFHLTNMTASPIKHNTIILLFHWLKWYIYAVTMCRKG